MEDYKFLNAAFLYGQRHLDEEKFMTIAEQWAKSKHDGKPIVSGSLPVAEQGAIDDFGHHHEWKFCPGCGIDWDLDTGADQFGCWSCGFVRQ